MLPGVRVPARRFTRFAFDLENFPVVVVNLVLVLVLLPLFAGFAVFQDNNPRRLTTLGFKFRKALLDLMELVDTCEPWYIRCIKPNDQKAANTFSSK